MTQKFVYLCSGLWHVPLTFLVFAREAMLQGTIYNHTLFRGNNYAVSSPEFETWKLSHVILESYGVGTRPEDRVLSRFHAVLASLSQEAKVCKSNESKLHALLNYTESQKKELIPNKLTKSLFSRSTPQVRN